MGLLSKVKGWAAAALNPAAVLGTGAQLYGDYEAKMAAKRADSTTREMNAFQLQLARDQMAMQKEFAQHGLRWKAEDAAAAGLHPLAAISGSGASYSPVATMLETPQNEAREAGSMYRTLGQNLSRSALATMTMEERAVARLRIESMDLDNQIKAAELRKINSQPPVPSPAPGQASANWQETTYPSVAYMRSPTGVVPIMPPNLAEALESDELNQKQWIIRYKGGPNFSPKERPAKELLPPGASGWIWNFGLQEWQPVSASRAYELGKSATSSKVGRDMNLRAIERRTMWNPLRRRQ